MSGAGRGVILWHRMTAQAIRRTMTDSSPELIDGILSNPGHETFCQEYVSNGGNAAKAYAAAGYSENGAKVAACMLLRSPKIKERIGELQSVLTDEFRFSKLANANRLLGICDSAMAPSGDDGKPNHAAAVAALKELNRMFGHHAPAKREHDIKGIGSVNIVAEETIDVSKLSSGAMAEILEAHDELEERRKAKKAGF